MTTSATPTPDSATVARLVESALAQSLRAPLHSVLGLGELLLMTDVNGDQHRLVEQVMGATERLLAGTDRLAVLLGTLSGAAAPTAQPFDVAGVVADVQAMAGPGAGITARLDPDLPTTLVGDVEALRYLLSELVDNAVRHGRRAVTVTVTPAGTGSDTQQPVLFSVSDQGPGLLEQWIAALTGGSVPVPTDANRIGLYLVARLAKRLGADLSVADGGTRITVRMTLRRPAVRSASRPAAAVAPAAGALRVLLVEDNAVNRLLTERQMARLGHSLHSVTTGSAGVAAALADEYDVILMDRHLPDLDGIEATWAIRAEEAARPGGRRIPIVAVTADAGNGNREQCLAAGMDAFLTKPVSLERLRAALTSVVVPRPAATSAEASMDIDVAALEVLAHELDGDASEVVSTYLSELPGRRLRLQTAIRQSAPRGAIVAADGLRAASLTVGAVGVARICAEVIVAANNNDLAASRGYLPDLLDACQRTADGLASILATA